MRTNSTTDTDVLVIGAGPTGLLLAGDLAAAGIDVTLVERRPHGLGNMTRAFGVHARTLEQLDARGLANELLATGTTLTSARLFGRLDMDMTRLPTRFNHLLVTPQYEVERLLERRAVDAGVTFRYGTELRGLRQDADGVTAELTDPDGTPLTLRARYLVGTDGHRSSVRTALGLPFPGRSVIRSIVLADVRLTDAPTDSFSVAGAGDTFAFIAPFGDGWYRVMGWTRTRQVDDSEPVDLEEVREIARKALGTDHGMHDARWISRFHSDERQAPAYRVGRAFLAGDAAHVHSPAGGQGMNTGLQDAANLSWKLTAVLRGEAPDPEALLDSYQSERHPVGTMVLRSSGAIVRLAMAHTPLTRAARSLAVRLLGAIRPASARAVGMISGIGISYAPAPGSRRPSGRRAPDAHLREGRLYELLRQGEFVLIAPEGANPAPPAGTPVTPKHLVRATWTDPAKKAAVLIRPDGYVHWTSN
ncbi:FAD-dependent oxidoreductase [Streptomyces nymphaeiformis]|uniref:2-polyprenyl-6-methoxyphenol hydroxylase-like FAD-dependent oxidoreductase n=1 Tax=Streptomyces nymphaeiformis TaxID=2663842 RepID=A0A7W7U7Z0_9ACTN|nr:FAD-dependent oxidoreductase [Streptomyces nymphaeiformis]MBB4985827.1 2-polyprenyl-6-methoxyphenol hydroxylase-like FAD-dependent oxidoreductase [Streptomyces nymphaeiformis]